MKQIYDACAVIISFHGFDAKLDLHQYFSLKKVIYILHILSKFIIVHFSFEDVNCHKTSNSKFSMPKLVIFRFDILIQRAFVCYEHVQCIWGFFSTYPSLNICCNHTANEYRVQGLFTTRVRCIYYN